MQRHVPRHFTAYTITAILYLSVIAAIYYAQTQHFVSSKETKEKVIQMSLSTFVPEVKKEVLKEVIEEPIVEEVVKEEPKVEEVVPEPVIEKVPEKPIVEKPIRKKPKVRKPKVKRLKVKNPKKKKVVTKTKKHMKKKPTSKDISNNKAKKKSGGNKTWHALQVKINKYKMYPRIAKKRRMEGSVKIQFIVSASGNVKIVSISGRKIFYKSARNAVKRAFPINPKKAPIPLPSTITLNLHYNLRY